MKKTNPFIDSINIINDEKKSPQDIIFELATKYTAISSHINKSTSQRPYIDYFKMHKDFIPLIDSMIEKIESVQSKSACIKVKLSIIEMHDSIQKEYHRRNNFIQDLDLRFR